MAERNGNMGKARFKVSRKMLSEVFQLDDFDFVDVQGIDEYGVITFIVESSKIKNKENEKISEIRPAYSKVNAFKLVDILYD